MQASANLHDDIPMLTCDVFLNGSSAGTRSIQNAFGKICFATSCSLESLLLRVSGSVLHNRV